MKKFSLVLLLGLLVLVVGCSKKKSTQPEPEPDYTLQATQTIGPEGDTLVISDFSLIVPPGAFASNATLKLYASTKDKPFGDYGVTRTFRLEGLPIIYATPLHLRLKYQGSLSNESFVVIGTEVTDSVFGETGVSDSLLPATDSSGYLLCELLPIESSGGFFKLNRLHTSLDNDTTVEMEYLLGITSYYRGVFKPFFIFYPGYLAESAAFLLGSLKDAYDIFKNMGFNYTDVRDSQTKIDFVKVIVKQFPEQDKELYGHIHTYRYYHHEQGNYSQYYYEMTFNEEKMGLTNLSNLRMAAGTLFFKLVDEINEASAVWWEKLYVNYWFYYATLSWCEELFTDQSNYVPASFKGNELAPFEGICAPLPDFEFAKSHGYGMSAVIKYLVDQYGDSVVAKVYDRLRIKENCITAIINSVKDSTKTWWPDFFKEYVGGRIYGVKGNLFAESKLGEFNINSISDTLKIFTGSYRDLSAKIYRINLNYPDIDSSAQIRFQLNTGISSEYVTVMVFGLKGDSLEYFDQGDDLTVKNAKDLTSQGYDLVAVVVNSVYEAPYNEKSNIDLEIKVVTKPEPQLTHNRFSLGVEVMGHWLRDDGSEYDYRVDPLYCYWGYGSFSGYTFQASWDESFDVGHSRGHMTATVDPTLSQVTSYSALDTTWFTGGGYYDTIIVSISGSGLPIYSTYGGNLEFRVYGTQACNYISSLSYRDQNGEDWVEVKSYWCNSESDLVIWFSKE